jgi:hypothetical protein
VTSLLVPLVVLTTPPARADVTQLEVNSAGDATDATVDGTCETVAGNGVCTLRAALKEAAAVAAGDVQVGIAPEVVTAPIALGSPVVVPANTTVDGCNGDEATRPCVTVSGDFSAAPVVLAGTNSGLKNVAVTADDTSVGVKLSGSESHLNQVWVGMDETGAASPLAIGVWVTGDHALVGSEVDEYRTTIVNAATGIQITGANGAAVNATNIGLNADGLPAPQDGHPVSGGQVGIRIAAEAASFPTNTNIGNPLTSQQQATVACDGACNAIGRTSLAGIQVDLPVEAGAPSVYVNGNHIGLAADGATPAAEPDAKGIEAGNSTMVLGGDGAATRNVIAGGAYAVRQVGSIGSVDVQSALIGTNATGTVALPPSVAGVQAEGAYSGVSDSRVVVGPAATGIEFSGNGQAYGNVFGLLAGGAPAPMKTAIRMTGNAGAVGSATPAQRNVICSASGAGIVIAGGDNNAVRGNRIGVDEAGAPCTGARANRTGVVVKQIGGDQAQGNRIGDIVAGGNTISNSVHNAITIASTGSNDAPHNLGTGNGGLMIDIGGFAAGTPDDGDGVGNPFDENGHIPRPGITTATTSLVSGGGGSAGDHIYVYATDSAAGAPPHGVTALIGTSQVSADGVGWQLVPSTPLAPGTRVTAIAQSAQPNSVSEFSAVATVSAPPNGPGTSTPLTVAGSPTLKGRARVGKKLKVVVPGSAPAGAVVTVQWLVGRRAISGATGPALKLGGRHLGKKVSARVTWTLPGSAPVVLTTARVKVKR